MRGRSPAAGLLRAPRARSRSWLAPDRLEALDPHRKADRGDRPRGAEPGEQGVVAAACHQLSGRARLRIVNLEDEAGVIIDAAAERGRKVQARDVDALCGQEPGAIF